MFGLGKKWSTKMLSLIIVFIFFFTFDVRSQSENTLRLVQIFFRHGQRFPTTFLTFPTDPTNLTKKILYEGGEMTIEGMQQEFSLGKNLREYYGNFLNYRYQPSELRALSGADNRTVSSALIVLSALFPPQQNQIWNKALQWIPIPVQTNNIIDEVSFGMFDDCQLYRRVIEQMPVYESIFENFRPIVDFLEEKTGVEIPNAYIFQKVLDGIKTRAGLPDLLPLPYWANDAEFIVKVKNWQNSLHASFIDIFLDSIGGWHHDQIVARFDEALQNTTKHKLILYSAHDTNIMTLGRLYNLTYINDNLPDFASYLSFELHEIDSNFVVQIWLHPHLYESRLELDIKACPKPCNFSQFAQLIPRFTSQQWGVKCNVVDPSIDDRCTLYASIAGALVIFIIIVFGALLSILWSCLEYRNKYNNIADPERHKLLR